MHGLPRLRHAKLNPKSNCTGIDLKSYIQAELGGLGGGGRGLKCTTSRVGGALTCVVQSQVMPTYASLRKRDKYRGSII